MTLESLGAFLTWLRLIDDRREAFKPRTSQEMGDDNVWLAGRRQEHDALDRVILKLEHTRLADGAVQAKGHPGRQSPPARTDAITDNQDNH